MLAALVLLTVVACQVQAKPIRLRNQTILPEADTGAAAAAGSAAKKGLPQTPASGLFLVQLRDTPAHEQRAELAAAGVELLHYVPDDAYVARIRGGDLARIRALSYVEWVGKYQPSHKVHEQVLGKAKAASTTQMLDVAVLVAPRATGPEIGEARKVLHTVRQESTLRAGTVLRGRIPAGQLDALARSEAVLWIEPARDMKLSDEVASKIVAGDGGPHLLLPQTLGYDGSGVIVAVADSGLNNGDAASMHPDLFGRTPEFFYYGNNLTDAADEHSHGTHVAGIVAGNGATGETDENGALYGLGVAPGASIVAQRIFDGVGNYEAPPSYERLTRDATRAGAVIGSNSWGDDTQGRYDLSAMEFDDLVRDADALQPGPQPYILEFSAGNAGPGVQTIGSPAVAKNVIATGASQNDRVDFLIYGDGIEAMADFSSRGPCEDGRIKPDIVAPGTWISSLQSASASDQFAWSGIDAYYQYQGGTSQAGPHASGAAAVFVQYYRETHAGQTPSAALVKAALINSAVDLDNTFGTTSIPNMDEGWGRIDLAYLFSSAVTFQFLDQTVRLTNSQVFERRVVVAGNGEELKVTLAYSDVPGLPAAIPALVNDLDLEVVAPDGQLYRGNQFENGQSAPNPPGRDSINNVEGVHIYPPLPGEYIIRVRAQKVVQDAIEETADTDQDFALVVSGQLAVGGNGVVSLDRAAYRAPDRVRITLVDQDLAGQPSAAVQARSTAETLGENVVLLAAGSIGAFTGSIATATGPAIADGRLQVAHGDSIEVTYWDVSAGVQRVATARADLVPPVLGAVSITNEFGQAVVSWTSDEEATSIVRYGTNATLAGLNLAVTNLELTLTHQLTIEGIVPGRTYYCYVSSADEAGNVSTNSNSGAFFSFVVPPPPVVLLVDSYQDPLFAVPPLSGYTDALNAVGLGYDVWDAGVKGSPSLSVLQSYRAVIWRVPELVGAWTESERAAISNYVHSGGGLLVASMEVLSRLEENGGGTFARDVLQVGSYVVDPQSTGAGQIIGVPQEPISSDLNILMDYTPYDNAWGGLLGPDLSDTITPTTNAAAILRNGVGDIVGLRWPKSGLSAPGRLVFLSFPLDAVPLSGGTNDRVALLHNILLFLAPGSAGAGVVTLDSPAYTLPSLVGVQVADSDLAGQGTVTVSAASTTQASPLTLTLMESAQAGVFVGNFTIWAATNAPDPGKLYARNGDVITVTYFDASLGVATNATAVVDTVPPSVTNVFAEPDYIQATISWDTSKPADALVEFGESPLLARTGYEPGPDTRHFVTLTGLAPDRTYYYRVISRDAAGNTILDDNGGAFYTFHTLLPLMPPWADSLDTGATNWAVINSDGSEGGWTLGVPSNGIVTAAHSAPNAWGSNLSGGRPTLVETFLVSPAIYIPQGSATTLAFWHAYDFTDTGGFTVESAQVQIVTDNAPAPVVLREYGGASMGWEGDQIDLSRFGGTLAYVVWYYLLISFDDLPHPGWLVDDVSISSTNIQLGSIRITNNLWQAGYILSGSAYLKGKGLGEVFPNASPGQYIVEFVPVPFYLTPAPQTNTLAPGGSILFQGNYTFPDANQNGISDLWEARYFGAVSPNRTRATDTDGDGVTDYAEFIAGTDPGSPAAPFKVTTQLSNSVCRLMWPSVAGQQFQLYLSTNYTAWNPWSNVLTATSALCSVTLPASAPGAPALFRVEALCNQSPTNLPPNLRLTSQLFPDGQVTLSWQTSPGHGYRLEGSTNAVTWMPISDWKRSGSAPGIMTYPLPPFVRGAPYLFRVQVAP